MHNAQKPHAARAAFAQPTYLFNEQQNFDGQIQIPYPVVIVSHGALDFQNACAKAGRPIQNIDLGNIQLAILRPINLTFETPLSMYDESFWLH